MDLSIIVTISGDLKREKISKWLNELKSMHITNKIEVILVEDCLEKHEQDEKIWRILPEDQLPFKLSIYKVSYSNPGDSRNHGFKKSTGKWIAFWDFDDVPNLKILLKELSINENTEFDLLIFGFARIDSKSLKTLRTTNPEQQSLAEIALNPGIWRMLFAREKIMNLEFPSLSMAEDQVFLSKIDWDNISIMKSNKIVYNYYVNQSNQLTSSPNISYQIEKAIDSLTNEYQKSESLSEFQKIIFFRLTFTFLKRINKVNIENVASCLYYFWLMASPKFRMSWRSVIILTKGIKEW